MNHRTRTKLVKGMMFTTEQVFENKIVMVRVTKDEKGKTLSLQAGGVMILIPVEPVEDMIDVVGGE